MGALLPQCFEVKGRWVTKLEFPQLNRWAKRPSFGIIRRINLRVYSSTVSFEEGVVLSCNLFVFVSLLSCLFLSIATSIL